MRYHDPDFHRVPLILGHRGARRTRPENTVESLDEALREGADGVEYDVQISTDGVPFLYHDDTLLHLCGVPGKAWKQPIAYLESLSPHRGLDGRATRARIPRLAEVLASVGGVHDLELKLPGEAASDELREGLVEAVAPPFAEAVASGRIDARSAVTSFDPGVLDRVARLHFGLRYGPIAETRTQWDALLRWRPARNPSVLALAAPLAEAVLEPGAPLPEPFREASLWLWNVPEETPGETLALSPAALIVDDPGVRARLSGAL